MKQMYIDEKKNRYVYFLWSFKRISFGILIDPKHREYELSLVFFTIGYMNWVHQLANPSE